MASLDRAYGIKGAAIALGAAAVAGAVHGVLVTVTGWLVVKVVLLAVAVAVLVIGGTVSARQSLPAALAIALAMALAFFWARWSTWSVMSDGGVFLGVPPWGWWGYISTSGVRGLWFGEFAATLSAAVFGCMAGHERAG
ncbi:MAG: hypothetical protein AAFR17_02975 [Pseudomonadota bacterium]